MIFPANILSTLSRNCITSMWHCRLKFSQGNLESAKTVDFQLLHSLANISVMQ